LTAPRILGIDSPPQNVNAPVVPWHYDYLLRFGAIADGDSKIIDLIIQAGSPFVLRGIGGYNVEPGEGEEPTTVLPLTGGFIEFTDSQDQWLFSNAVSITADWPGGGLNAQYEPVYQQIVYGPASTIQVRLTNSSGADWADARVVFRGTHLYFKERVYSQTYPKCYTAYPYEKQIQFDITPTAAGQTFRDQPFIVTGADYVFRGAVLSLISGSMADLEFIVKDQYEHPYSSDFIHHSWLFSTSLAQRPGIWYPEIYLPKDRMLLVDIFQGANAAFNVQLSTMGTRIFPK